MAKQKTRQQRRAEERERAAAAPVAPGVVAATAADGRRRRARDHRRHRRARDRQARAGRPRRPRRPVAAASRPPPSCKDIATIPASRFDQSGTSARTRRRAAPSRITGAPTDQDGKPLVVYVGADYCPFCAAERWPLVAALERFGTFKTSGATHSARASTSSRTRPRSRSTAQPYSSQYISLRHGRALRQPAGEWATYAPLESPTRARARPAQGDTTRSGTIPFIYLGRYAINGATLQRRSSWPG